MKPLWNIR